MNKLENHSDVSCGLDFIYGLALSVDAHVHKVQTSNEKSPDDCVLMRLAQELLNEIDQVRALHLRSVTKHLFRR